ncbi:hypothetical protein SFRURICE_017816 [Spodoptera frugiperda]|nr:hypothetical protein SFRURICE_017816 [Spodoptera frugiperda]
MTEISPVEPEKIASKGSIESPMLFCICCLSRQVPYIRLSTCSHAEFLNSFGQPKIESSNQVVCYTCHNVLKKIKSFTLQVKNSFNIISEESNIQISPQQNRNLQIHRQESINIPQTNISIDTNQTIDSEEVTNETPEMSFKRKSYERKIKNIGNALKIINSNQNNACINLLATSLNSLSSSLINKNVDFNNFPILNAFNKVSQSVGHISEATDTSSILEAMVKDNLEANSGIREEELILKYSIQSRINTIRLSKEDLMAERSKLASSPPYLKAPYKCETCKENSVKCDVCQQYFNQGSNYNDHIAYHYTRLGKTWNKIWSKTS